MTIANILACHNDTPLLHVTRRGPVQIQCRFACIISLAKNVDSYIS